MKQGVAGRLAFPAPSLALRSTRPPSSALVTSTWVLMPDGADLRGLPLHSTESPPRGRRLVGPRFAPLRSPLLLPGPVSRSSSLGVGRACSVTRAAPPSAPPSTALAGSASAVTPCIHSRSPRLRAAPSASRCHSRSLVPSSWFRTTSTACSAVSLQACCILLPTLGFTAFLSSSRSACADFDSASPRCDLPSKDLSSLPWALRSPGALAPVPFLPSRGRRLRGFLRQSGAVASVAVASDRSPVLPGLLLPLRGARVTVADPCGSSPNRFASTARRRSP
jgi:hypothetical protein